MEDPNLNLYDHHFYNIGDSGTLAPRCRPSVASQTSLSSTRDRGVRIRYAKVARRRYLWSLWCLCPSRPVSQQSGCCCCCSLILHNLSHHLIGCWHTTFRRLREVLFRFPCWLPAVQGVVRLFFFSFSIVVPDVNDRAYDCYNEEWRLLTTETYFYNFDWFLDALWVRILNVSSIRYAPSSTACVLGRLLFLRLFDINATTIRSSSGPQCK